MTIEEIKALLYTKDMLDRAFYEMIDKDIPCANYEPIMIALRRAKQEIFNAEMDSLPNGNEANHYSKELKYTLKSKEGKILP